jgi:starvation-inducible DNA-binding protein
MRKLPMKKVTPIVSVPSKLATPSDLSADARQAAVVAINPLAADAFALFVKTKNFHWHVSGSHYRDYHLLFDEQAQQIFNMIDVFAERVRKLGGTTIHSIEHIGHLQSVKDDNEAFVEPREMMRRLMEDNKDYLARMRGAHDICSKCHDFATTSILEVFLDETERRIWFLYETYCSG